MEDLRYNNFKISFGGIIMKRVLTFGIILMFMFLFLGCSVHSSVKDSEPGMIGYVVRLSNNTALVTNEDFNAISFSNFPDNIKVGDKVKVWYEVVAESYPGSQRLNM